jgi:hypothetical protein
MVVGDSCWHAAAFVFAPAVGALEGALACAADAAPALVVINQRSQPSVPLRDALVDRAYDWHYRLTMKTMAQMMARITRMVMRVLLARIMLPPGLGDSGG